MVNIGDMLGKMANNLFESSAHRVWNFSGMERYAGVFFLVTYFEGFE